MYSPYDTGTLDSIMAFIVALKMLVEVASGWCNQPQRRTGLALVVLLLKTPPSTPEPTSTALENQPPRSEGLATSPHAIDVYRRPCLRIPNGSCLAM